MYTLRHKQTKALLLPVIIILGVMALFAGAQTCLAHPHVFIESELEIELGEEGVKGLWHRWTFDEYFSAWIVDEYDTNKDGQFSPEETQKLYEEAFKNLKHYGFWTTVLKGNRDVPVTRIENFTVKMRDHQATYSFFIPLDIDFTPDSEDLFILVYDKDFYCQIFFPPAEISFTGEINRWNTEHTTQKMPELTYYFGFVTPVAVRVSLSPP